MYQCHVSMYNLSSKNPLYTSSTHLISICSTAPLENKLHWCVAYGEGPVSFVMPLEIVSYPLVVVPIPSIAGNGLLPVHFASILST